MKKSLLALGALSLSIPTIAQEVEQVDLATMADHALKEDRIAWDFVEGITTEVGPRQAGTEAEARGRAWAVNWLEAQGFANVADEPFDMPTWVPGNSHKAEVIGPFPQSLVIAPLGNSVSTGEDVVI